MEVYAKLRTGHRFRELSRGSACRRYHAVIKRPGLPTLPSSTTHYAGSRTVQPPAGWYCGAVTSLGCVSFTHRSAAIPNRKHRRQSSCPTIDGGPSVVLLGRVDAGTTPAATNSQWVSQTSVDVVTLLLLLLH
jgi:hypothetical protein